MHIPFAVSIRSTRLCVSTCVCRLPVPSPAILSSGGLRGRVQICVCMCLSHGVKATIRPRRLRHRLRLTHAREFATGGGGGGSTVVASLRVAPCERHSAPNHGTLVLRDNVEIKIICFVENHFMVSSLSYSKFRFSVHATHLRRYNNIMRLGNSTLIDLVISFVVLWPFHLFFI